MEKEKIWNIKQYLKIWKILVHKIDFELQEGGKKPYQ